MGRFCFWRPISSINSNSLTSLTFSRRQHGSTRHDIDQLFQTGSSHAFHQILDRLNVYQTDTGRLSTLRYRRLLRSRPAGSRFGSRRWLGRRHCRCSSRFRARGFVSSCCLEDLVLGRRDVLEVHVNLVVFANVFLQLRGCRRFTQRLQPLLDRVLLAHAAWRRTGRTFLLVCHVAPCVMETADVTAALTISRLLPDRYRRRARGHVSTTHQGRRGKGNEVGR